MDAHLETIHPPPLQTNLRPRNAPTTGSTWSETNGILISASNRNKQHLVFEGADSCTSPSPCSSPSSNNLPPLTFDMSDFECSLCFRIFYKPISTPCGHTYCRPCLLSGLKYRLSCPLCRAKLEPPSKYNYSVNVVLSNLLEKHFKKEYEERRLEGEEEDANIVHFVEDQKKEENTTTHFWSTCLVPSMRTCCVLEDWNS
jgi:hypothetical protein